MALVTVVGAASAQSAVTLFGVLDANLALGRGTVADRDQIGHSGNQSSRLGFRGTEDLGGGMSASFWLEAGLNNDDGSGQLTNTNNQADGATGGKGLTFNRRSTVSLAGGWGELRLGRDYAPQYWNLYFSDPFGGVGVGLPVTTGYLYRGITGGVGAVRASNSIGYFLPGNLGGFYGQAQYSLGENQSNAVSNDGKGAGLRVGFANGPFNVGVATARTRYAGGDTRQSNLFGTYDFGVAKVGASISRDRKDVVEGQGWQLSSWVPLGAGQILAGFSRYETNQAGNPESKQLSLGYVHNLSKRTALYTTVARVKNSGGADYALNGSETAPNASSTGLDLGVRHNF